MIRRTPPLFTLLNAALLTSLLAGFLAGCQTAPLHIIAESDLQWNGLAYQRPGTLYVSFPRWSDRDHTAVATIDRRGNALPYPDARWNDPSPGGPDAAGRPDRFVAVQSVHIDAMNRLWVLDTGMVNESAGRHAVVYEFHAWSAEPVRTIVLPDHIAPEGSVINDIRLSPDGRHAFISDSGLGAIIVIDLFNEKLRRVLAGHPSTKGSADRTPIVDGRPWLIRETGRPLVVHCDGVAVSPDGEWVYYQALSNDQLYRIPTAALADFGASEDMIEAVVEPLGTAPVTDGMIFDPAGNLYFSAIEANAIIYRTPNGTFKTLVQSPEISWPDSFAIDREHGLLLFTTALIHRTPPFSPDGSSPSEPYRIWSHPLPGGHD